MFQQSFERISWLINIHEINGNRDKSPDNRGSIVTTLFYFDFVSFIKRIIIISITDISTTF